MLLLLIIKFVMDDVAEMRLCDNDIDCRHH